MQTPTRPERPMPGSSELDGQNRAPLTPTPRKKTPVWIPLALIAALLAAGLFIKSRAGKSADASKQGDTRSTIRTVKVVAVTTGTLVSNVTITGQLKSNQNVNLGSKISGIVRQVYVNEGQRVQRGQLVVQLDDADLRQQVDAARAAVESAQVRLQQTQLNLPSRVQALSSAVDQARANLENAQAAVQSAQARYQQALLQEPASITTTKSQLGSARAGLRSAQAASKSARDTARQTQGTVNAAIASARAGVAQARAQLEQTVSGNRAQQIAAAEAQVNTAQAQLNLAKAQLENAQTNLNRQQLLFQGGATAQASVDAAQTAFSVAQSQVGVAQAQLEAQRQNRSLIREGARTQEVTAAQQLVSQREAALQSALADRNRVLASQSAVTQSLAGVSTAQENLRQSQANQANIPVVRQSTRAALDAVNQARAQVNLQRALLQQTQNNLSQAPGFRADVPAARAALAQTQAQLQQAQVNLNYARITSPVNGVVATKFTDAGQSAGPGTTLLNLVALDNVVFEAQIPETQLAQVKVGQPARVTITSVSDTPIIGYVSEIIPVADARLRQFRIRIRLPQTEGLTPGAFARGSLQTQVVQGALTLPDEVVRTDAEQPYVYVATPSGNGAEVKRRTVKVGISANGKTQIIGGVNQGDKIVSSNSTFQDGDKVKTQDDDSFGTSDGSQGRQGKGNGQSGVGGGTASGSSSSAGASGGSGSSGGGSGSTGGSSGGSGGSGGSR